MGKSMPTNLLLLSLFAIFLFTRLLLINENAMFFFPDEHRFSIITESMERSLAERSLVPFVQSVFSLDGRPGFGFLYTPAAALIALTDSFVLGQITNVVFASFSFFLLFFLVKKRFSSPIALLTILFYALSFTSLHYIRHMLPYEAGLFLLLLTLLLLVYSKRFAGGISAALAFATYPGTGFFLLPMLLLCVFVEKLPLKQTLSFINGVFITLFVFELFSLLTTQTSYFYDAVFLSTTVNQGDFLPAFLFYGDYIFATDGLLGLFLGFFGPLATLILWLKKPAAITKNWRLLFTIVLIVWGFFELLSFITQHMVLYGRTIRPFYIANIVLSSIALIYLAKQATTIHKALLALLFGACLTFHAFPTFLSYKNALYPTDFMKQSFSITKTANLPSVSSIKDRPGDSQPTAGFKKGYYFLNTSLLYPYYGLKPADCNPLVIKEAKHIETMYYPYAFEGKNSLMRGFLKKDPPVYQLIYCQT